MFRIARFLINLVFGIIEFLLALRFILEFFAANPRTPFVAWIYSNSSPFLRPFFNIFPSLSFGGFVLDTTTLAALIVYGLVASLLLSII